MIVLAICAYVTFLALHDSSNVRPFLLLTMLVLLNKTQLLAVLENQKVFMSHLMLE